jgi:quinol-cytochrome oxidoreductase complex cytochrome b subunit
MANWLKDFWHSIWRIGWPKDDREATKAMLGSLVLHIHAPKVRPGALKFRATWLLGLISVVLTALLIASGVYLMFYYVPHPDAAFRSMKDLYFVVPYGIVLRNLHRWGAHAMVVFVTLHMARVFLSGGYKAPRQANWLAGTWLWVLTMALSFTGYLLPWDQLAFWAVTVGANMAGAVPWLGRPLRLLILGDTSVGEAALLRFYVLHCVVLPLILVLLVAFHLFRVRKDGGLVTTEHDPAAEHLSGHASASRIPAWPHLVYREFIVTIAFSAILLAISILFNAPLEPEADPTRTPNPAKAPWYFLGIQELAHWSAFWGGVFIPGAVVLGFSLLPYLDRHKHGQGRYFAKERRVACWLYLALMAFFAITITIGTWFRGPAWQLMWWPQ